MCRDTIKIFGNEKVKETVFDRKYIVGEDVAYKRTLHFINAVELENIGKRLHKPRCKCKNNISNIQ